MERRGIIDMRDLGIRGRRVERIEFDGRVALDEVVSVVDVVERDGGGREEGERLGVGFAQGGRGVERV